MNRDRRNTRKIAAVTLLVAGGAVACGVAYGNPTAPQVVNGQASFVTQGNTLTVTNTSGTIINWQSFSNAADEVTRFVQQSSTSSVLNRVVGVDPSTILGTIQSNGRVFLINPNGILFGAGARIDVNGLVASTLPLSNDDFLAGKFSATAGPVAGAIRNQGAITTPAGGKVWLIAPEVENSGIITAPDGDVLLAAGRSVHLVDSTDPDIAVVISAPEDKALNLGRIVADSGKVGIYGGLLSQKGVVSADSAVVGKDGRIFFRSTHGTTLGAGSVTTASGSKGGDITVSATEGNTIVSGTVTATGSESVGGSVKILGSGVSLLDGAQLDVSGGSGGGTLLVGGDYQGKNQAVQNAQTAYVAKNALLRADGVTTGDGGRIIVWSDGSTRAYGTLSARGGFLGGNGGLIETSGHFLDVSGIQIDAASPRGLAGTWLLDPLDIEIAGTSMNVDTIPDSPTPGTLTVQPNALGTPSQIFANTISGSLDAGTNVIITTSVAGAGTGNITVSAPVIKTTGLATTLTLDAVGGIFLNNSISNTSSVGKLDVSLIAGTGNITFNQGGMTAIDVYNPGFSPGTVTLSASSGGVIGQAAAAFDIAAGALDITSRTGIGTLATPLETKVESLSFTNSISGGVAIVNDLSGTASTLTVNGGTNSANGGGLSIQEVNRNMTILGNISTTGPSTLDLRGNLGVMNSGSIIANSGSSIQLESASGTIGNTASGVISNGGSTGSISLRAPSFNLVAGSSILGGSRDVQLLPYASGVTDLGLGINFGLFNLTDVMLDSISTTGKIWVGDSINKWNTMKIGSTEGITLGANNINLAANSIEFTQNAGITAVSTTGNVSLQPGTLLGHAVAATDVQANNLAISVQNVAGNLATIAMPLQTAVNSLAVSMQSGGGQLGIANTSANLDVQSVYMPGTGNMKITNSGTMALSTMPGAIWTGGGTQAYSAPSGISVMGNVSGSSSIDFFSTAGSISQSAGAVTTSSNLTVTAATGISLAGNVASFSATNGTSGGITLNNSGALTVNSITQNSSTPVVISSNGNMLLGSINAAGGGVVTLRANNGSITDFNSVASNVTGAFRVDFNDGSTTAPGGVGTNLDAIEVDNLGAGGVTADAGSGGIYIANTAGSLKLGGISYNGTSGDVVITSATDTTITGALLSLSGHTGNMTVDVNGPLTINAAVNKGGSGSLLLRASGASSDVIVNSNILGNGNGVSLEAGRHLQFNGRDTGTGIVDNLVSGTSLNLASVAGNIFGALAQLSTGGNTTISASASGTVSLSNGNNSLTGPISVSGGNNVSVSTSGNMTVGSATQAGILTLQSMNGWIFGSSPLGGTQLNATAATGINLTGANAPVTVNLANMTSGGVSYSSSVGNAMTLTVTGSNNGAGGTFSVNEATGDLRVGASGISTADGGIILSTQKSNGNFLVGGTVNAGLGNIELSGYNLQLQEDMFGNVVRLKAHGIGDGILSVTGTPMIAAGSVIELLADNMSLSGGQFIFSNATPTNTIWIRSVSDNRPITIGAAACTMPGCLRLADLSDALFSTPRLRIGNHVAADINTAGNIDIAASVNRSGMLSLLTAGSITQSAAATLGMSSLALSGASVDLREANPVGIIAGRSTTGDFLYRSSNQLTISFVDGFSGISAAGSAWLQSDSAFGINQNMGASMVTPGALVLSAIGPVNLMDGGNNVGTLAADLFRSGTGSGGLQFSNGPNALIINSGLGISGIRTNNQPIMVIAGGTPANGLFIRNAVNGGTSFVNLLGPSVFLDSGSTIAGGSVRLSAIEPAGGGFIAASGPTAPVVQALKSIELEADNLSFAISPTFTVSNADIRNEIAISTHTNGRPITVGTACAFGGPCLLLSNVSTTLFNAPTLVIGSEDMLPTTSTKPPIVAGDISIASAITRAGRLALLTGGSISQSAPISVDIMAVVASGAVNLTGPNAIGKLAALTDGPFAFTTTGPLEVASVIGGTEDPVTIEGIDSLGNITLTSGGNLTLGAPIDAGMQTVTLSAGGAIVDAVEDSLYSASIYAGDLDLIAVNGIGSMATPLAVDVVTVIAENNGSGDVVIENAGALDVLDVNNAGGAVELAAFAGDLNLWGPVFAATDVFLAAEVGAIIDNNGGATSVEADSLEAYAATGIGSATAPLVTTVSLLSATSDAGDVVIKNTGAMTIGSLSTGGTGSISLDNAGAVTTGGSTIQAPGTVTVIAPSPLTIGTGGVSAGGNILLEAVASGGGDIMVVTGAVVSSSGSIDLRAGDTVTITSTVSAPAGMATKTEWLNISPGIVTDLQPPVTEPPPATEPEPQAIVESAEVQNVIDQAVKEIAQVIPQLQSPTNTVVVVLTTPTAPVSTPTTSESTALSTTTPSETTPSSETSTDSTQTASSDPTASAPGDGAAAEETADGSEGKEDEEKKDAEKKQDKGQNEGEKKDDAPKKKQYCN